MKSVICILCVAMLVSSAASTTIEVPGDYPTIQAAIDAATHGDVVLVSPGTYVENINFLGKAITVVSSGGRDMTFIAPGGLVAPLYTPGPVDSSDVSENTYGTPAVQFTLGEGELSILDGFSIRNPYGRGIYCQESSPTIQNCEVSGCYESYSDGGGIFCVNSGAKIFNNLIHDNIANKTGGGLAGRGYPAPEVAYNRLYNNTAPHGAGMGFVAPVSGVDIHHNLVVDNVGEPYGQGAVYINGTASRIINNTVAGNTNGVTLYDYCTGIDIFNNIIVSNEEAGLIPQYADYDYNDVWDNAYYNDPGVNGISLDPLFVDPAVGLYFLQVGSPCIDAGHPDPIYNDPDGSRNDMGAFPSELTTVTITDLCIASEIMTNVINHTPTIEWNYLDPDGLPQATLEVEVGDDADWMVAEMWASGQIASSQTSIVYSGLPLEDGVTYYMRARAGNGTEWSTWVYAAFRMNSLAVPPVPDDPVAQELVRFDLVSLTVVNTLDTDGDELVYGFEVYSDPSLTFLVASQSGVEEQTDMTSSDLIGGLVPDAQYWWRARCFDGFEYTEWSAVESFLTVGIRTIHVPADYPTIQSALDVSGAGDTIIVAPGTYGEYIDFLGKDVVLVSSGGRDVTFITPPVFMAPLDVVTPADSSDVTVTESTDGGMPLIRFLAGESDACVLDGFTINNPGGHGIFCYESSPIIQNCDIRNCYTYDDGAGIWCVNSGALIRYNKIHDNRCGKTGGGVAGKGTPCPELCFNEIYDNQGPHGAGVGFVAPMSGVNIHHNLVRDNVGESLGEGAVYLNGDYSQVINNTVVGNTNGVSMYSYSTGVNILNNIIVWNVEAGLEPEDAYFDYNDVWSNGYSNDPGSNGFSLDPMFVDAPAHDYTLQLGSPCFNAGHPDPVYNDPDGSRNDIGAYWLEVVFPVAEDINMAPEEINHVVNHIPTVHWTCVGGTQTAYEIEVGTDNDWTVAEMWTTGAVQSADWFAEYAGEPLLDGDEYFLRMRVSDGSNWGSWALRPFRMNSVPSIPALYFPIDQAEVRISNVDLIVANSADGESDALTYDFEIYAEPGMVTLIASQSGVEEIPDYTKWEDVSGLLDDTEYWWRSRAFDGYEYSDWPLCESFVTIAAGPIAILVPQSIPTIQGAIDYSVDGDTVIVSPGTYPENIDFLGRAIVVRSSEGPDVTFIAPAGFAVAQDFTEPQDSTDVTLSELTDDDGAAVRFISGEGASSILDGFTITKPGGRGIFCFESSPIIQNCEIRFGYAGFADGGGIYCVNSGATIRYNKIHDNVAGKSGGGVAGIGTPAPEVCYNEIRDNFAPHGAGVGFVWPIGGLNIHHNLVFNNAGQSGGQGAVYINGERSRIINNTVVHNTGGITLLTSTDIQIYNNIVVNNIEVGILPRTADNAYNDAWNNGWGNDPGQYGISADPLFVDPYNLDFSLQANSPCIDTGHPDEQYNDPDGSRSDMGAFWFCLAPIYGIVSVDGQGMEGVLVDLYGSSGKILASEVTDETGLYAFDDLENGFYTVSMTTPLGFTADQESRPVEVTHCGNVIDFALTALEITPPQRTLGYWLHQVSAHISGLGEAQETYEDMCTYLEAIRKHFNMNRVNPVMVVTMSHKPDCDLRLTELYDVLSPKLNPSHNDQARAHLSALLLNVVSRKLSQRAAISQDGASVSQAITFCDSLIFDNQAANDSIAALIPELINKGQMVPAGLIDLSTPQVMYKDGEDGLPTEFALGQNYPNPFNPMTGIEFALPRACRVKLEIFNVLGQRVTTLVDGSLPAGYHRVTWDGRSSASGVYLYRLQAGDYTETKKMTLVK